jgi:hypothetical protein
LDDLGAHDRFNDIDGARRVIALATQRLRRHRI